jgi:hypothetical protein
MTMASAPLRRAIAAVVNARKTSMMTTAPSAWPAEAASEVMVTLGENGMLKL